MNPYDKAISTTGQEDRKYATIEEKVYVPEQQESLAEDASRAQAKLNWLQSTVTQEIVAEISKKIEDKEQQARELAATYPSHQNALQIVKLLQESTTLRTILKDYASNT